MFIIYGKQLNDIIPLVGSDSFSFQRPLIPLRTHTHTRPRTPCAWRVPIKPTASNTLPCCCEPPPSNFCERAYSTVWLPSPLSPPSPPPLTHRFCAYLSPSVRFLSRCAVCIHRRTWSRVRLSWLEIRNVRPKKFAHNPMEYDCVDGVVATKFPAHRFYSTRSIVCIRQLCKLNTYPWRARTHARTHTSFYMVQVPHTKGRHRSV